MNYTFNINPPEPKTVAYDWKGQEIYSYENYYDFSNYKVVANAHELLDFAKTHMKKELYEILLDNYDYAFSTKELAEEIATFGVFVEGAGR